VETQRVVVGWRRYDWGVADLGFEVPAHIESKEVDWDAEEARVQREWREAKAQVLLGRLEPNYREATTNHGLSRKWLQAYDEGRHVNLTITGKTGTGKTWEAAALTRSLLVDRMVPVVFTRVPELLDSLRPDKSGIDIVGYQAAPTSARSGRRSGPGSSCTGSPTTARRTACRRSSRPTWRLAS
jgi:hypothetical protein